MRRWKRDNKRIGVGTCMYYPSRVAVLLVHGRCSLGAGRLELDEWDETSPYGQIQDNNSHQEADFTRLKPLWTFH
jgi:hypothetical protein